jgi:hypothetical protein
MPPTARTCERDDTRVSLTVVCSENADADHLTMP